MKAVMPDIFLEHTVTVGIQKSYSVVTQHNGGEAYVTVVTHKHSRSVKRHPQTDGAENARRMHEAIVHSLTSGSHIYRPEVFTPAPKGYQS